MPGKSHGQRSVVGYSPWGRKELDTTERHHSLTITHDLRCILSLFPVYSILPLFFFLILKLNTQQHWAFCYSMNTICLIWDTFCWFCDISTFQFSSVTELCPTLCDPMDCSTSGLPVYHQLEFSQTHVHSVGDPFNNLCFTYSFLENSLMFQVLI